MDKLRLFFLAFFKNLWSAVPGSRFFFSVFDFLVYQKFVAECRSWFKVYFLFLLFQEFTAKCSSWFKVVCFCFYRFSRICSQVQFKVQVYFVLAFSRIWGQVQFLVQGVLFLFLSFFKNS